MVDTMQPHCLFASDNRRRGHAKRMNLRNTEKREPLAPLQRLAGKKTPRLSVQGEVFLLTSPFIERAYRTSGIDPILSVRLPELTRHIRKPLAFARHVQEYLEFELAF